MEEYIQKLNMYIWELYYAGLIDKVEFIELMKKWRAQYYEKLEFNKTKAELAIKRLSQEIIISEEKYNVN